MAAFDEGSGMSLDESKELQLKGKDDADPGAMWVRKKWQEGTQAIRAEQLDYWLNWAFLQGHQWLYFQPNSSVLEEFPRDPDRIQAVVNRMWPNTRTIVSTLMQREMVFEVTPEGADDAHIRGARLSEGILRSLHDNHNWERLRERYTYAIWKGGTAAIAIDWNPDVGNTVVDDVEGHGSLRQGDIHLEVLNITEFCVEPGAREGETALHWTRGTAHPPGEVQARFNLDKLPPADATAALSPFQHKLLAVDRRDSQELVPLTMVLTYYERPNSQNPEGRILTVVDHTVVHSTKWNFPFKDRLNLAISTETPKENRWTGETVLSMARPVQTMYNVSWSSIAEHMKLASNARLVIPQSAADLADEFTDLPGEILVFPDGSQDPKYISAPQMPSWWIQQPVALGNEMDDIMGVHDISRGSAPANIESGLGLSILAEKDSTPVGRLTKEMAHAWGRVASMALKLYEKNTPSRTKRESSINMEDGYSMKISWTGKDLYGQTSAKVPLDAVMPRSRAAQMEFAKTAAQMGLIPEGDIVAFMDVAEMPGRQDMIKTLAPDVARARRENAGFANSVQSVPIPEDDHQIHIAQHLRFIKTLEFELLAGEEQKMIREHIKAHEVMAAEEIGAGRAAGAIDPALAEMMPSATGAPPVMPLEPGAPASPQDALPPTAPDGGAGAVDAAATSQAVSDVMSQLEALGRPIGAPQGM